jgi:hypothetical protein
MNHVIAKSVIRLLVESWLHATFDRIIILLICDLLQIDDITLY